MIVMYCTKYLRNLHVLVQYTKYVHTHILRREEKEEKKERKTPPDHLETCMAVCRYIRKA